MCCGEQQSPSIHAIIPSEQSRELALSRCLLGLCLHGRETSLGNGFAVGEVPTAPDEQAWVALQEPVKSLRPQRKDPRCNGGTDWQGRKAQGFLCSRAIPKSSSSSSYTVKNFPKGTRALGLCCGKPGAEPVREASSLEPLATWLYLFAQVQPGPAVDRMCCALCPAGAGRCFAPPAQPNEGMTVLAVHPAEHSADPALCPAVGSGVAQKAGC